MNEHKHGKDDDIPLSRRLHVGSVRPSSGVAWDTLYQGRHLCPVASEDPNAVAVLLTTSGTASKPKFVAHNLSTLLEGASRLNAFQEGERVAFYFPMVHASGLFTLIATLLFGAVLVMLDGANADNILDGLETHKCTTMFAFPYTFSQLILCQKRKPRALNVMRLYGTGGDACHPYIYEEFR
jgi:acyl-coenzyme A synthetase/AMP-(fatty) acid ligase